MIDYIKEIVKGVLVALIFILLTETSMPNRTKKFLQVIDGDIPLSSLTQIQLKQFAKILRSDPEIVNEVYTNLIKQSMESNPKLTEEKFLKIIQSKINAGEDINKILKKLFNNDELAVGLLERKMLSKLDQLANNKLIPDPNIIPVPKVLSKTPDGIKTFQKWLMANFVVQKM